MRVEFLLKTDSGYPKDTGVNKPYHYSRGLREKKGRPFFWRETYSRQIKFFFLKFVFKSKTDGRTNAHGRKRQCDAAGMTKWHLSVGADHAYCQAHSNFSAHDMHTIQSADKMMPPGLMSPDTKFGRMMQQVAQRLKLIEYICMYVYLYI